MNELIKAAAEDMHSKVNVESFKKHLCSSYAKTVTHYLAYAKSQGFGMVKVDGDVNDIAFELVKQHLDKMLDLPNHLLPRILSDTLKQALAIGKAHGVKEMGEFAEWVSDNDWEFVKKKKVWFKYDIIKDEIMYKTTAELITEFQNREV